MRNTLFYRIPVTSLAVAAMIIMSASVARSQSDSLKTAKADTGGIPLKYLVRPVAASGELTSMSSYPMSDSAIMWSAYTYAGDLLQKIPGTYLANMYQPGAPSILYFDGLGSSYTKYLLDGVELNEPTTSTMNLYQVPVEFARNVQFIDAVRAPIYQFNANGALVNFQSHQYSEPVPYSKVRHLEEPYNYLITDGIFSQNIGYNSNIDVGFERQTTDGRFANSVYDGVNIRGKYRYSIDSTNQLTATEVYYRTKVGATGGDMPYAVTADIFVPSYTDLLRSRNANLTYLQHHVQIAYSRSNPEDSAEVLTATAFFDYYSFQYGDDSASYYLTNLSRRYGANLRGSENLVGTTLNFGAEAVRDEPYYNTYASIPKRNRLSIYADEEFSLMNFVRAGLFGRGDLVASKFYPAIGASFGLGNDFFSIDAGGSISRHLPSLSEMYFVTPNFTGNPRLVAETDEIFQVEAAVNAGGFLSLSLKPYVRLISDPIYYAASYNGVSPYPDITVTNLSTRDIYGVDAALSVTIWKFTADGNFSYLYEKTDGKVGYSLPQYFLSGELFYHDILFTGHLNLKIGFKGKVLSSMTGNEFYPQALIYYPASLNDFGISGSTDFFVRGKVGDAIIYFTIFNITGANYVLTPVYPALDNSFCIGVNWEFLN